MTMYSKWAPPAIRFAAIASTIACYGAPAAAQSTVTIYGAVDSGLIYQTTSAASFNPKAPDLGHIFAVRDGGMKSSFWGLKGIENLGGGYQVVFKLQSSYSSANGKFGTGDSVAPSNSLFNQVADVGLSGPFGSVTVGRQVAPMWRAMEHTDVRAGTNFGSIYVGFVGMNTAAGWGGGSTNAPLGAIYDSNAIVYQSPTVYGLTGSLEFVLGGVAGNFQAGTRQSAALQYANAGLHLGAFYYNAHDTNPIPLTAPATGVANNRMIYFGALYDFSNFSVSASYANGKNPSNTKLVDIDMYAAGLGYTFSPALKVTSGVYYLKDKNESANKSMLFAVGAEYGLSKTTTLYAQWGEVNNRGDMTQMVSYGQLVAPGTSTSAVNIGIRHTF